MDLWVKFTSIAVVAGAVLAGVAAKADAANDRFKEVLERGTLRVGVQGAYPPWSYRDPDGRLVGIEPDLAADVAEKLGVKLELVQIESANRMQLLQQGRIDLILGAMSDLPERRKVVGMVQPAYWVSGANVMAKAGLIKSWEDLSGKPLCAKQGLFYNTVIAQAYDAKIISFSGNTETKQALRSGKCAAWLSDDTAIQQSLRTEGWDGYEMPLKSRYHSYWAAGVPLEERDGIWGKFMTGMSHGWHASGKLIELAEKWKVVADPWFEAEHEKLLEADNTKMDSQ
ncbi:MULTISPECIES: transporter substrate-binding domain-containing protein [unclassified Mesorhizobium]|uniref:transporter substrate-binding domain-containing protein n=1 Tax=unclassified Mesorhizobium TaxID=325217 RepID=UPI00112AD738|nr:MULTISPECIES: transporter substrate-binding domain-containing protein [unclassified Mesorhizobium]TPJ46015.1 transporter substrate-binding domain-containing protein [Mesorhizobium sp. B2-6-6]MBZ9894406.1 transporter substrate-binding domain-containing protein [Mesorhizobium sp. BR1-1-6]MCA0008506.1 transporter substrate-binding domain-containing protein [Mesorhizobium sp. B264B1B]MCA0018896.1 transporter substrate-binding domain-containing protein [Mesorhizobium sp. B264B1A]MCA0025725.1 tra